MNCDRPFSATQPPIHDVSGLPAVQTCIPLCSYGAPVMLDTAYGTMICKCKPLSSPCLLQNSASTPKKTLQRHYSLLKAAARPRRSLTVNSISSPTIKKAQVDNNARR